MATPIIDALQERSQRPVIQQQVQRSPIIAQALLAQGMSPEPIDSGWEALGRLAQTWAGNRLQNELLAQEEAERTARAEELSEIMAGMNLNPEQARLIGQLDPDQQIEALLPLFASDPIEYGFTNVDGTLLATNPREGTASPVYTSAARNEPNYDRYRNVPGVGLVDLDTQQVVLAGGDNPNEEPTDLQLYQFSAQQYIDRGEEPPTYDEWDLARKGRLGGIEEVDPDAAMRAGLQGQELEVWSSYLAQEPVIAARSQDLEALALLADVAPGGPITGRLLQMVGPGWNTAADAMTSIISRLAPTFRVEGSGSTSDIEYQGMLNSLPMLSQTPDGRKAVVELMQAKAQLDLERARVVHDFNEGRIDGSTARAQLAEINGRSIVTDTYRSLVGLPPVFNPARPGPSQQQMPVFEAGREYTVINGQIVPIPPQGGYGGNDPWQQLRGSP